MKDMFVQTVMMFSQSGQINPQYYKLVNELEALKRRVKKLDGKNVFFVHQPFNPSTATMIVSEAEVDQIVTQAMYMNPKAFNEKFFGGKTAPDKLKFMTGSLNRAIAKRQAQPKRRVLRTRREFMEFYQQSLNIFDPLKTGKMGSFLNKTMTKDLTRKR